MTALTMTDVLKAQQTVEDAQQAARDAVSARAATIRQALADGVGAVAMAESLGVNRQRVYAMANQ
ncbi:hypothetical protein [Arthrobacter rhombi]|uniref:hypothetical protein n=1 Tax=Arthrobacter rhombi TaxID=71253 RepID=UPI003FD0A8CB